MTANGDEAPQAGECDHRNRQATPAHDGAPASDDMPSNDTPDDA